MRVKSVVTAAAVAVVFVGVGNSTANAQTPGEMPKPPINVVVQPGDSLEKIATQNKTTYNRLFDANPQVVDPDIIHPGDNIRIPAADEQLAGRPIPVAATPKAVASKIKSKTRQSYQRTNASSAAGGSDWDRLAQCEAGGNWNTNTGNGYSGGLQFSDSSWRAAGGSGKAASASREEQISRAENLKAKQGWGAWPACSSKLGLR